VVCATNKDLREEVRAGRFREDLLYRLNVITLHVPLLRERKEDIPVLSDYFLQRKAKTKNVKKLSTSAARVLMDYDWPGNVRELENAIERAVAMGSGPIVHVGDLPSNLHYPSSERVPDKDELLPMEELERRAILRTLRETGGDKLAAARMLGIGKTTLYRKLKQYQVEQAEP
jgi:DNA-binding NtrC family response regulator